MNVVKFLAKKESLKMKTTKALKICKRLAKANADVPYKEISRKDVIKVAYALDLTRTHIIDFGRSVLRDMANVATRERDPGIASEVLELLHMANEWDNDDKTPVAPLFEDFIQRFPDDVHDFSQNAGCALILMAHACQSHPQDVPPNVWSETLRDHGAALLKLSKLSKHGLQNASAHNILAAQKTLVWISKEWATLWI